MHPRDNQIMQPARLGLPPNPGPNDEVLLTGPAGLPEARSDFAKDLVGGAGRQRCGIGACRSDKGVAPPSLVLGPLGSHGTRKLLSRPPFGRVFSFHPKKATEMR